MKNLFGLTQDEKNKITLEMLRRVSWRTAFPYYINNCVSIAGCPKRLGSFVCDLIYWIEDVKREKIDISMVGYYVNELFYSDDRGTDEEFCNSLIEFIVPEALQEEFKKGIKRYI